MLAILVVLVLLNLAAYGVRSALSAEYRIPALRSAKHDRHWYQWAWRQWLPAKWQRIAHCETGTDWRWDSGSHVSAFGITRWNYMVDAHVAGGPSWDEARARGLWPTPRQQFQAALAHYRMHGGFSGWGCRNA